MALKIALMGDLPYTALPGRRARPYILPESLTNLFMTLD